MGRHSSPTSPDASAARTARGQDERRAGVPTQALPLVRKAPSAGPSTLAEAGTAPADGMPDWPEQLADQPFDRPAPGPAAKPPAERHPLAERTVAEHAEPHTRAADERAWPTTLTEVDAHSDDRTLPTGVPVRPADLASDVRDHTPTEVEQAEEEHLDWLLHLPESRDDDTAERPPSHSRADRPVPRESPRREWVERLVVGLLAGLVTFAAARWAWAAWSTATWIGVTVLLVVPTVSWVATLGHRRAGAGPRRGRRARRSSVADAKPAASTDPTTRVGT